MKKYYSTIMMFAIMVAALSFTACDGDDDEDNGGSSKRKKTLTIDGEAYYCDECSTVSQGSHLWLTINAIGGVKDGYFLKKELTVVLRPSRVSELSVGEMFDYNAISIYGFRNWNEIVINHYNWDAISGRIAIREITETTLTIQIIKLVIKSRRGVIKTIDGTAELTNSICDCNGNVRPFSYK